MTNVIEYNKGNVVFAAISADDDSGCDGNSPLTLVGLRKTWQGVIVSSEKGRASVRRDLYV